MKNLARTADSLDTTTQHLESIANSLERLVDLFERVEAAVTIPARVIRGAIYRHIL